jgi:hypothetical protein
VCLAACAAGADRKWVRRTVTAAACAASAFDVSSTNYAISRGAIEANPLVANNGRVRWGRASLIKIGICTASWIAGEMHLIDRRNHARADKIMSTIQLGYTGVYVYAGVHNRQIGNQLQTRPSYLVSSSSSLSTDGALPKSPAK